MIIRIVDTVETLKKKTCEPYIKICDSLRLKYPTIKRWRNRIRCKQPVIRLPGPKKVQQLNAGHLEQEIKKLKHCRKRSHGSISLYQAFRNSISRREFAQMVAMARYDTYVEHQNNQRRIHWRVPGLVWSMDDTEWGYDETGRKLHLHNLQDMASSYKFSPIAGEFTCGEGIAAHLARHYKKFGPPLFQKRDNGGNLNHSEVNYTLDEYGVIPLNSPTYYPQYNGSIEVAQNEFKRTIRNKLCPFDTCPQEHFGAYAEAAVNELNQLPRRRFKHKNAWQVFFEGRNSYQFTKRQRRAIYDWILERTNYIFEKMDDENLKALQSAYRIAVETWLRMKGFIFVSIGGKVLPNLSGEMGHN